jgi:hypothetical protein
MNREEVQQGSPASTAAQPEQSPDVSLDRHAKVTARTSPLVPLSDADRYQWIRTNRGNIAIVDALHQSDRDADFDAQIDVRMSKAGRHQSCCLGDWNRTGRGPG